MKYLEDGKVDFLNEEEFLKAQENLDNQGGEDGKDMAGFDSSGGMTKYGGGR